MRIRLASAVLSFIVMMLAGSVAQAQWDLWGGGNCDPKTDKDQPNFAALKSAVSIVSGDRDLNDSCQSLRTYREVISNAPCNMSAEWKEGLKFSDAVNCFKIHMAAPGKNLHRARAITNAYHEVYGRLATPAEQAAWDTQVQAQKAWYATIAFAEIKKLNASQSERRSMVNRAYEKSMGRNATVDERGYWVPRIEHYRSIVDAARTWLYSSGGANDLVQTVTRALTVRDGKAPSEAEIKNLIEKANSYKKTPIYSEMIVFSYGK